MRGASLAGGCYLSCEWATISRYFPEPDPDRRPSGRCLPVVDFPAHDRSSTAHSSLREIILSAIDEANGRRIFTPQQTADNLRDKLLKEFGFGHAKIENVEFLLERHLPQTIAMEKIKLEIRGGCAALQPPPLAVIFALPIIFVAASILPLDQEEPSGSRPNAAPGDRNRYSSEQVRGTGSAPCPARRFLNGFLLWSHLPDLFSGFGEFVFPIIWA